MVLYEMPSLQVIDNSKTWVTITDNGHQQLPIINLDIGDPTMYESYWKDIGEKYDMSITIPVFQSLSYFANPKSLCWFLEPKLEEEIKKMHAVVGNATTKDRHLVVGTGSSQLILAALYALADSLNHHNPIDVVAASPIYSSYPEMADVLRSSLTKWSGDAHSYEENGPYIEIITSPNNPDGSIREPVVNGAKGKGMLIHDLAYYWPQYTSITSPAYHDIMLFTLSKCTGHAGSRVGWALVKDEKIAQKMVHFLVLSSIGVSKESQLRAASILNIIRLSCQREKPDGLENFFEHHRGILGERWNRLRDVVKNSNVFTVPQYPTEYCNFFKDCGQAYPGFAWVKCEEGRDCENLLKQHKIVARGGTRFGSGEEYVRASIMGTHHQFDAFLMRLATIHH